MSQYDTGRILEKLKDDYWKSVETDTAMDKGKKAELICFTLGAELYCLDVTHATRILKVPKVVPLPKAPDYVLGIINLRGQIISVMDLRKRLDVQAPQVNESSKIIIVRRHGMEMGLLVDSVLNLMEVPEVDILPPPHNITGEKREFVRGQISSGETLITVLNTDRVIGAEK
jgi:purine-binding chemotaxis protein CheW